MTLRTALMIAGDSEGAKRALAEMDAALERGEKQALEYNAAYERTDATIKLLANAQAAAKREIDEAKAALAAGKITQAEYNREILETKTALGLVQAEYRNSSTELLKHSQNLNTTTQMTGAQKAGAQQLAFQLGDMATMYSMNARPMQIFASQGTQVVQAIGLMRGEAGGLIGFLGGPWGIGIMAAVTAMSPFIMSMLDSEDAANQAEDAAFDFANGLDVLTLSADRSTAAMRQLVNELRGAIAVQGDYLRSSALLADQSVGSLEARISNAQRELAQLNRESRGPLPTLLPQFYGPSTADLKRRRELQAQLEGDRAALADARRAQASGSIAVAQQAVIERRDPRAAAEGEFNRAVGELNRRRRLTVENSDDPLYRVNNPQAFLSDADYRRQFDQLSDIRDAAIEAAKETDKVRTGGRERSGGSRDRARNTGRLSDEARELERRNEQAVRYISGLEDEIEAIGLDEKALRQLEIQRAKEAAVTDDQRTSIDDLNQKREKAIALEESRQRAGAIRDETKGTEASIASLEREAQAIGLVGWARERLLMRLEQQAQMDALLADLSRAKASGMQEEIDALLAQIDALQMKNALETQIGDASEVHREQAEAAERNAESYRHLGRSAAGALSQILIYGEGAGGVMKRLATSIADAILQANLLGEGPLAGIFGGGGGAGGLIGSLLGAIGFGGGRASGGPVSPGQIYAVNERSTAPGFFLPVGPGRIEPPSNDNPAGGSRGAEAAPVYFDLRGAVLTKDLLRQMNRIAQSTSGGMIGRYDSELPERIDSQAARFR